MYSRRDFLKITALATTGMMHPLAALANRPRPNVLVILADDMGFSDAGCYGGEISTSHLDSLARNGIRMSQMYSTGRCWPSRACILTGHYAQQVRMDPPKGRLPAWTRLAPHYLKPAGYRCYHSGKWHIRGAPKAVKDGGFDRSYLLADQDRFFSPRRHWKDDEPLPPVSPDSGYYATTAIADHAVECLKEHARDHQKTPFFHYLAFTCPHFPLHALQPDIQFYKLKYRAGWDRIRERRLDRMRAHGLVTCGLSPRRPEVIPGWNLPEEKLQSEIGPGEAGQAVAWDDLSEEQKEFQATKMAIHAAMIHRMDREIGRVLEQLKAMGAFENTLIMFVSDNGASAEQIIRGDRHDKSAAPGAWNSYLCLGPGWSTAANTPLSLHKSWVHEGGISSPCIVHWPAGLKDRGVVRHNAGHFIDLLPTILDLTGTTPAPTWRGKPAPPPTGRSLTPVLLKNVPVPQDFLFFHHSGNRAIRIGDWKLVAAGAKGPWELYNLKADRGETENLADRYPEKARAMVQTWERREREFRAMAASDAWNK